MRLIWRGPEFSEAVWGLREGLRTGKEAGARKSGHPHALRSWSSGSVNLGYRMVAVSGEVLSPLGSRGHSAVPFLTRGCPTATEAVGVGAVSWAHLILTREVIPSSGVSMRSHSPGR